MACPDNGSDENVMREDLARTLGLHIYQQEVDRKKFVLANGKIIESVGRCEAPCNFGTESHNVLSRFICTFYVFQNLASQLLMGASFLGDTETLTKNRDRLVKRPLGLFRALRVRHLGSVRERLSCEVDGKALLATPDTGAELDLVSNRFAQIQKRNLIQPGGELIMFADGSIGETLGVIRMAIRLDSGDFSAHNFHVLDNLSCDLILGENLLDELEIYTKYQHKLVKQQDNDENASQLQHIIHLGNKEEILAKMGQSISTAPGRMGNWITRMFGFGKGRPQQTVANEGTCTSPLSNSRANHYI
jgi:hypothetical protein